MRNSIEHKQIVDWFDVSQVSVALMFGDEKIGVVGADSNGRPILAMADGKRVSLRPGRYQIEDGQQIEVQAVKRKTLIDVR